MAVPIHSSGIWWKYGICLVIQGIAFFMFHNAYGPILYDIARPSEGDWQSASRPSLSQVSTQLAFRESFGFFTDIPDENWEQAKEIHAQMFPNFYDDLTHYSNGPNHQIKAKRFRFNPLWYGENFQEEFHCSLTQRLPTDGQRDGPKWVCDPHRLRNRPDCLVYSVGCFGKVEFEMGIKEHVGNHCEIHTFDIDAESEEYGSYADTLEGLATFHHWGLGSEEESRNATSGLKTLAQTMKELGHEGRRIDILKIDCEWCEWFTFRQWLEQDIQQILVETHQVPMPHARDFFFELHDAGYVIFNKESNYITGKSTEFGFLKLSTDFFRGNLYQTLPSTNNKRHPG